jgi:hypothetical protein
MEASQQGLGQHVNDLKLCAARYAALTAQCEAGCADLLSKATATDLQVKADFDLLRAQQEELVRMFAEFPQQLDAGLPSYVLQLQETLHALTREMQELQLQSVAVARTLVDVGNAANGCSIQESEEVQSKIQCALDSAAKVGPQICTRLDLIERNQASLFKHVARDRTETRLGSVDIMIEELGKRQTATLELFEAKFQVFEDQCQGISIKQAALEKRATEDSLEITASSTGGNPGATLEHIETKIEQLEAKHAAFVSHNDSRIASLWNHGDVMASKVDGVCGASHSIGEHLGKLLGKVPLLVAIQSV